MGHSLDGRCILVPESRELDLFASMIEREGATTIRCPLIAIHDVDDAAPVEAWLRRLAQGELDDLILLTGEGVSRLIAFARRFAIEQEVLDGMRRARKIARGPKPTRALRQVGLSPEITAHEPTSAGVIEELRGLHLKRRRVGVQLYPDGPDTLADFLREAEARADPILCYRYAADEDDDRVADAIQAMADGTIDAVAFTSSPQVRRLRDIARKRHMEAVLERAMASTRIMAIGPVTAQAVEEAGWTLACMPHGSFRMKPFVKEIATALAARGP